MLELFAALEFDLDAALLLLDDGGDFRFQGQGRWLQLATLRGDGVTLRFAEARGVLDLLRRLSGIRCRRLLTLQLLGTQGELHRAEDKVMFGRLYSRRRAIPL